LGRRAAAIHDGRQGLESDLHGGREGGRGRRQGLGEEMFVICWMRDQVRIYFCFGYIGWFVVSEGSRGIGCEGGRGRRAGMRGGMLLDKISIMYANPLHYSLKQ
jgi:hypothetical protein